ncbi:uncharacterized protein BT62DRAFT_931832 [Guyanagaster necrorhizus]|uniref:Uncharacterized protein n=1 Tax=Guyanagaster necrorhizus TaxID=856835 RepID=A0A9P7VS20_9AGAR|nr:uncharacterized protein BT62DRAFT_931832 [Guyanagaster necrorhizus MCA 3950]KAG7446386.1 hypothetical protein BT62DRAFT_931832 [Guyanagaster necrorhizus MCA 3950]
MTKLEDQRIGFCSLDLRYPPIDPRRSRRRCMNFGFGREELHPKTPALVQTKYQHEERDDTSRSVSTPLDTYTGTESDLSPLKDIEFELPWPPSIGPMIRRMKSSPSFAESLHTFSGHCTTVPARLFRHNSSWSRIASEQQLGTPHEALLSSTLQITDRRTDGLLQELEESIDPESLILNAVNTSCAARWQKTHRASKTDPHLPSHVHPWSRESHATPKSSLPHEQNHTNPASASAHNRMPRIIRRVVSLMTSPRFENSILAPSRTTHKMRSWRFIPLSESQSEKPKPQPKSQLRGRSISMEFQKGRSSAHGRSLFTSSSSNVKKPFHKSILSLPLAGLRPSTGSQMDCNPPISKRPVTQVWHRPVVQDADNSVIGLTSFIDITPEQRARNKSAYAGRDRVRNLWQKASNSILGWGKTARKKT